MSSTTRGTERAAQKDLIKKEMAKAGSERGRGQGYSYMLKAVGGSRRKGPYYLGHSGNVMNVPRNLRRKATESVMSSSSATGNCSAVDCTIEVRGISMAYYIPRGQFFPGCCSRSERYYTKKKPGALMRGQNEEITSLKDTGNGDLWKRGKVRFWKTDQTQLTEGERYVLRGKFCYMAYELVFCSFIIFAISILGPYASILPDVLCCGSKDLQRGCVTGYLKQGGGTEWGGEIRGTRDKGAVTGNCTAGDYIVEDRANSEYGGAAKRDGADLEGKGGRTGVHALQPEPKGMAGNLKDWTEKEDSHHPSLRGKFLSSISNQSFNSYDNYRIRAKAYLYEIVYCLLIYLSAFFIVLLLTNYWRCWPIVRQCHLWAGITTQHDDGSAREEGTTKEHKAGAKSGAAWEGGGTNALQPELKGMIGNLKDWTDKEDSDPLSTRGKLLSSILNQSLNSYDNNRIRAKAYSFETVYCLLNNLSAFIIVLPLTNYRRCSAIVRQRHLWAGNSTQRDDGSARFEGTAKEHKAGAKIGTWTAEGRSSTIDFDRAKTPRKISEKNPKSFL